jgi:hypothetical protein
MLITESQSIAKDIATLIGLEYTFHDGYIKDSNQEIIVTWVPEPLPENDMFLDGRFSGYNWELFHPETCKLVLNIDILSFNNRIQGLISTYDISESIRILKDEYGRYLWYYITKTTPFNENIALKLKENIEMSIYRRNRIDEYIANLKQFIQTENQTLSVLSQNLQTLALEDSTEIAALKNQLEIAQQTNESLQQANDELHHNLSIAKAVSDGRLDEINRLKNLPKAVEASRSQA